MSGSSSDEHSGAWRDPAQVAAHWDEAGALDSRLLGARTAGDWWALLDDLEITLLVTREYENLVVGLSVREGRPLTTYMRVPHPSGLAVREDAQRVFLAATRNPNQVLEFAPVGESLDRAAAEPPDLETRPLVPVVTHFYPGALYLHDLAVVGGRLHGNAVGLNAVVRLDAGSAEPVWWPRAVERDGRPDLRANYLQLNSIAAGQTLDASFFTASTDRMSRRRPGHLDFPVDGRGVVFSGLTRDVVARGLTRPHSARLHAGTLWVDDSGYGRVGVVADGAFVPVASLRGWTRGLCFAGDVAFVGTSRVIPRFRGYAPGLDVDRSVCAVHAVDVETGTVRASITWPAGNQIFAIEAVPRAATAGWPYVAGDRARRSRGRGLFYSFMPPATGGRG